MEPRRVVCAACENGMEPLRLPICDTCGCANAVLKGGGHCEDCPAGQVWFEKARGTTPFAGMAKIAVEKLKYGGRLEYAPYMARHVFNILLNQFQDVSFDSIVPVPLHSTRYRERGFNQSHELAKYLAKYSGIAVIPNALVRKRPTPSQTRLSRRDRARNIAGAFAPGPASIAVGSCLLIDDVYTTGATLNECARVLRDAGATTVHCLAFARAIL